MCYLWLSSVTLKKSKNIAEVLKEHEHDAGASPRRTGAAYGKSSFLPFLKKATADLAQGRANFSHKGPHGKKF